MNIYEQKKHEFASILSEIKELDGVEIINWENEDSFNAPPISVRFFVTFEYLGKIWGIYPSTWYPFTDENNPGKWNFIPYEKRGDGKYQQNDYKQAYEGPNSLRNFKFREKPVNKMIQTIWYKE